ncbi:mitochondrial import receptor subunit TOM40 homolog [Cydia strobilella]|uniref:mitochondrial import receptor subunit TOM40 homolog n=1 Tax=Cydia strobilella TaxID=1100964 RepID=UPI003005109F
MDINEQTFKDEFSKFISSLQKLLPKKKDFISIEPLKPKVIRLADVHNEAKSVFPKCFIGTKLVIMREILDRVKLLQQYNYGRSKESYKCYDLFIHKEMEPKSPQEGLLVDWTGSATATYNESFDGYDMRLISKIKDLISSENEITLEKCGEKTVASVSCTMKDVDPNTAQLMAHWMYQIVPELTVGTELGIRPMIYPPLPTVSISARYEKPSFTLSGTLSRLGFQGCLFKQLDSNLRIATIVNEGPKGPATIGIALSKKYLNGSYLKIFVDSQRCGGFTLQKDVLFHDPPNELRVVSLVASVLLDRQRRVRLGFGFNLDF